MTSCLWLAVSSLVGSRGSRKEQVDTLKVCAPTIGFEYPAPTVPFFILPKESFSEVVGDVGRLGCPGL